ncbi:hypothetical protein FHG87_000770 [Trinorchestia longiramus]|nr:hypothetical protein FHG87_000770 [Trinorchestia longiramus]
MSNVQPTNSVVSNLKSASSYLQSSDLPSATLNSEVSPLKSSLPKSLSVANFLPSQSNILNSSHTAVRDVNSATSTNISIPVANSALSDPKNVSSLVSHVPINISSPVKTAEILPFKATLSSSSAHSLPVNRVAPLQSAASINTSTCESHFSEEGSAGIKDVEKICSASTSALKTIPTGICEVTSVNVVKPSTSTFQEMNNCIATKNIIKECSSSSSGHQHSSTMCVPFRSLSTKRPGDAILDKKQKYRGIVLVGDERFSQILWSCKFPKGKSPFYILSRHGLSLQTLSTSLLDSTFNQLMIAPGNHHWQKLLIVCTIGWRDLLKVSEETKGRKVVCLRHPETEFVSSVMREVVNVHAHLNAIVPRNKALVIFAHAWPVNIELLDEFVNKKSQVYLTRKKRKDIHQLSKFLAKAVIQINAELDDALLTVGSPFTPYQQKCPDLQWRFTFTDYEHLINGIIPSERHLKKIHPLLLNLHSSYVFQLSRNKTPFHQLYIIGDSRLSALAVRWPFDSEILPIFLLNDDITPCNVIDVIKFYCRKTDAVIFVPSTEKFLLEDVPLSECTGHAPLRVPSFRKKMTGVDHSVSTLMQTQIELRKSENWKHFIYILSPLLPFELVEKVDSVLLDHITEFEHRPNLRVKDIASAQQSQLNKYIDKLGKRLEEACVFANVPFSDAFRSMSSSSSFKQENWSRDIVRFILDTLQIYNLTLSKSKPCSASDDAGHEIDCLAVPVKVIDVSKRPTRMQRRISSKNEEVMQSSDDESILNKGERLQWPSKCPSKAHSRKKYSKESIDRCSRDEKPTFGDPNPVVLDYADELLQFRAKSLSLRKQVSVEDDSSDSSPPLSPRSSNSLRVHSRSASERSARKRRCARGLSESPEGGSSVAISRNSNHPSNVVKKSLFEKLCVVDGSIHHEQFEGSFSSSRKAYDELDSYGRINKNYRCSSNTRSKSTRSTSPSRSPSPKSRRPRSKYHISHISDHSHSSRNVFSSHSRSSRLEAFRSRSNSHDSRSPSQSRSSCYVASSRSHSSRRPRSACSPDLTMAQFVSPNRDSKTVDRKSSKKLKRRHSTSSSSSYSFSLPSSRKYRSSRGKDKQRKKKKKKMKKKKKIKCSERTRERVSPTSYDSSSSITEVPSSSVEELKMAYQRGLEQYLSMPSPHALYQKELTKFLASDEIKDLMEIGVPPDGISKRWEKSWARKVRVIEQEKMSEKQSISGNSSQLDKSQHLNNKSKEASPIAKRDSNVEFTSDENVDEVGEDLDIDCLLTSKEQNEHLKRSANCSPKLVVQSVLQLISLFKETIGVLTDALPLMLIKCTEMEKSGLNPLTAFGREEVAVLSLMLASIEAEARETTLPCHEEMVRDACIRELSRLLSAIELYQTVDLTSLAIQTLNLERNEALLCIAERLRNIGSTESALSVYNIILDDQNLMSAFIAENSQAFEASEGLSSS